MKFVYLFFVFFVMPFVIFSQNPHQPKNTLKSLCTNEIEDYNDYAIIKAQSFGKYMSYILDSDLPIEKRKKAAKHARKLFISKDIIIQDTVFSLKKPITIEKFIITLLENEKNNLEIEWNDIFSKEGFDINSAIKIVEIEQVVKFINILDPYLTDNVEASNKIIETHFIQEDELDPPIQIKLGKIEFKN